MSADAHIDDVEQWPFGVSRTPAMSIGGALSVLQQEFPAVSVSKVRFLEEQGIVAPHRTPSGYRTYSQADIERLRFALAAQRDSYLPLAKIRDRLAELDRGAEGVPAPGARVVTEDGELTGVVTGSRSTLAQLADEVGISQEQVRGFEGAGLVTADAGGKYAPGSAQVLRHAAALAAHGIDVRHLRALRGAADRQIDLIDQILAPMRTHPASRSNSSLAQAHALAQDLVEELSRLHSALLRAGVDRLG